MRRVFRSKWVVIPALVSAGLLWSGQRHLRVAYNSTGGGNLFGNSTNNRSNENRLVFVHVFHRHGDRTPIIKLHHDDAVESQIWSSLVCQSYTPYIPFDFNNHNSTTMNKNLNELHAAIDQHEKPQFEQVTQWMKVAARLRGCYLVHCDDNYYGKTYLLNTRDRNLNAERLGKLYTYEGHYPRAWMGKLTEKGVHQMEEFGRWLRKRYIEELGYLSPTYHCGSDGTTNTAKLWIHSTNFARTMYSVDSLLIGLYPMSHRIGGEKSLPIHVDIDKTFLYPYPKICRKWGRVRKRNADVLAKGSDQDYMQLKEDLAAAYGRKGSDFHDWDYQGESLLCRLAHKKDLPSNIPIEQVREFCDYTGDRCAYIYGCNDESSRLAFGVMLNKLMHSMHHDDGMFRISSCHDNTIMGLLVATKRQAKGWPPYASSMVFEVWERVRDKKRFARILYCGKVISLNGIEEFISLDELKDKWKNWMISEEEYLQNECNCD